MSDTTSLNLLIDKARAIAGSDAALARSLGVVPQRLANWRNGSASCAPEDQALIASVAGLDPAEFLVRAVVLKHQGTAKGDRLMKVLGKSSLAIGAVLGSAGASAHQIFSMVPAATTWTTVAEWVGGIYAMCLMLTLTARKGELRLEAKHELRIFLRTRKFVWLENVACKSRRGYRKLPITKWSGPDPSFCKIQG